MTAAVQVEFDHHRDRFYAGDALALLRALQAAARWQVVPPEWTAEPLADALASYEMGNVATLDDALGVKRPDGFRIGKHREKHAGRRPLLGMVYERVCERLADGESLTAASDAVALELCKTPRVIRNWWHEVDAMRATLDREALARDPDDQVAHVRLRLRELRGDTDDLPTAIEQAALEFDTSAENIRRWCFTGNR